MKSRLVSFALLASLVGSALVASAQPAAKPAPPAAPAPAPSPPAAKAAPLRIPLAFQKTTLPNGLEVIIHEDHGTPIVTTNVWYHVGSKDEEPGKNGFAHLFEHVMFQGSKNVGEDMFFKYLERAGASDRNGTTNTDRTNYFESVPSNQLELALWLESDRMGTLLEHANEKTFASQRDVVKNERRQNYENAPYGLVPQYLREALYPAGHPYRLLTIGTPEDLDRAQIEDVRRFFRTWYVPNNATLVVAGDLDPTRTLALVEKYFGTIPRGAPTPPRPMPGPVALAGETRVVVEAEVELERLYLTWPTPARFAPGDAELDVVGAILSSGKSSRLYQRLVYDLQVAQDVNATQFSRQLGSDFTITVTLRKGKSADAVLKILDEELGKLRASPPGDDELERARTKIVSSLVFGLERVSNRADMLNAYNQMAGDPGFATRDIARYEGLRAGDVAAAVQRLLPADKRIVTRAVPTPGAPRAGRLVKEAAK